MSWGELTCYYHWQAPEESPCTPELLTCNKKCPFYKSAIEEEILVPAKHVPAKAGSGNQIEIKCVKCGCTDSRACIVAGVPCHWITKDFKTQKGLCSACARIHDD